MDILKEINEVRSKLHAVVSPKAIDSLLDSAYNEIKRLRRMYGPECEICKVKLTKAVRPVTVDDPRGGEDRRFCSRCYYNLRAIKDSESEIVFDDFAVNTKEEFISYRYTHWTQICKACVEGHGLSTEDPGLSESPSGSGICGVSGCSNTAYYYYDFNGERI